MTTSAEDHPFPLIPKLFSFFRNVVAIDGKERENERFAYVVCIFTNKKRVTLFDKRDRDARIWVYYESK